MNPLSTKLVVIVAFALFALSGRATAQQTVESQEVAPTNKSSCEFHLDRAPTSVTKVEESDGGNGWVDITSAVCVDGGNTSSPKVKTKSGNLTAGRRLRLTVTTDGTTPAPESGEDWGTEHCSAPIG